MAKNRFATIFNSPIWKRKRFVRLWLAQTISEVGDQIYMLAFPLLVYNLTQSGTQMSFVFAFETLPYLVFSLIGGVLSDKWNRRYTMVLGNFLAMLPLAVVFILYHLHHLAIWHIYVCSILLSSVVSIILPAVESSIPSVVSQEDLVSANSLMESTVSMTLILGPIAAGALVTWVGADVAILINAVSFLVPAVICLGTRFDKEQPDPSQQKLKDILLALRDGLVYVPTHRILRWGMFMSTLSNIVLGAYNSLLIFYIRDTLHRNAEVTGLVLALSSVTSLLASSVLAPQLSNKANRGVMMILTLALQGIGVVFVGLSSHLVLLIVAQAVYTGSLTLYSINWRSLRQRVTPNTMIGRVSGVSRGIAFAGASLGGFLGGFLLLHVQANHLFVIDGALVLLIAFTASFGAIRKSEQINMYLN